MKDDRRDAELEAVRQWVSKAENDWAAVEILQRSEKCPADVVCFHCQQYAEKLLKGVLTLHEVEAPRTHDVRRLIQLALPFVPELAALSQDADALTVHGVRTRYPDDFQEITSEEMSETVSLAKAFGAALLPKLEV